VCWGSLLLPILRYIILYIICIYIYYPSFIRCGFLACITINASFSPNTLLLLLLVLPPLPLPLAPPSSAAASSSAAAAAAAASSSRADNAALFRFYPILWGNWRLLFAPSAAPPPPSSTTSSSSSHLPRHARLYVCVCVVVCLYGRLSVACVCVCVWLWGPWLGVCVCCMSVCPNCGRRFIGLFRCLLKVQTFKAIL